MLKDVVIGMVAADESNYVITFNNKSIGDAVAYVDAVAIGEWLSRSKDELCSLVVDSIKERILKTQVSEESKAEFKSRINDIRDTAKAMNKNIQKKTIWLIGESVGDGRWMVEGIYQEEADAVENAAQNQFIVESYVNEQVPADANQALKMYWPKKERWEDSALYQYRLARGDVD